jgi:hypothetical protein
VTRNIVNFKNVMRVQREERIFITQESRQPLWKMWHFHWLLNFCKCGGVKAGTFQVEEKEAKAERQDPEEYNKGC